MFLQTKRLIILFLFVLVGFLVNAQDYFPPVTNYNTKDYNAASQNWGLSTDADGVLYVANNEGLLRFDGQRWQVFTLPNHTTIRSVYCMGNRIYTGSYEEFGYWTTTSVGDLRYNSLTHLIDTTFQNEEFWQICSMGNTVYFRSFGKFYRFQDEKIIAFNPDFVITAMMPVNTKLYLGSNDGKLYSFYDEKIEQETKNSNNQSALIELSTYQGSIIAGTRRQGTLILKDGQLQPWGSVLLTQFLETNELNKIQPVSEDLIIFGTVKGGIVYYNPKNQSLKNHYRQNGLQNNTVLSLHLSGSKVWIGLDNGIDAILPDTPIQYFLDNTGQLGAVYDIVMYNGAFYAGSNTGIHKITDTGIQFIPGSQGQVWSFNRVDNHLFVNHNLGLFELKNDALNLISGASGSYSLVAIPQSDSYLNTTYNGLRQYHFKNNAFVQQALYNTEGFPVEKIVFERNHTFWAAHPYKGFYRAKLDTKAQKITEKEDYSDLEVLTAYKTTIHQIEGQTAFYNAGNWYRYNSINDSLEVFNDLKSYSSYALLSDQSTSYWFKNRQTNGLVYTDFKKDSIFIIDPLLESRIVKNYEKIIQQNDSIFYITLNEGYARMNLAELKRTSNTTAIQKPLLTALKTNKNSLDIRNQNFEVAFKNAGSLNFSFAAPTVHEPVFVYALSDGTSGQFQKTLNFQNLAPGKYTLQVWSKVNGKRNKTPLNIEFTVQRPWYLTNLMIVIYVLLLFGVIAAIAVFNKKKLNKHRKELELKLIKEQDRKNQIAERNKLLQEINTKRKELANTTYLAAKRNSSLIDIKNELEEVKEKGGNPKKVTTIQNKINHIIDTKDNWKVFETTFKEINDEFFHKLLDDYPSLSSKDLKLCAYLKMNLATKEIAPLMAISVRGVEIHRYRLRKKLGLNSGKNLSKFLIKNY